jgi:gliding motility-associated-like protein
MSSTADYIEADKPILVAQYMPSMYVKDYATPDCGYKGLGDPEMIYLSPIEQSINHLGFYRNTEAIIQVNYLTLIIPDNGLNSLKIDGTQNFSYTYPHPNKPGYTVVVKQWKPAGKAQCIVDSDSTFTSVTYGLGSADSYGYNGGTMVNNLNGTLSLHNVEGKSGVEHQFTCTNSPLEISMLMTYQPTQLIWRLSELANISPNADITQNNPVPVGTVIVKGISYFKYTVPGTYTFSEKGTFRFTVTSTHPAIENYGNRENLLLDIVVKEVNHTAAFNYSFAGCISDPVVFKWDPAPAAGEYVIDRWRWTFPEGPVGTSETESRKFSTNTDKEVTLRVITADGCVGTNTETISLRFPVKMQINASKTTVCAEEPIDFEAIATNPAATPVNGWYWNFGNGTTATIEKPKGVSFKEPGSYIVQLVGKAGGGACITDTVPLTIKVNARPYTSFTYPAGCLPADGVVKFVSKATASDGSLVTVHAWNFGDPAADAANPNTSVLADPSHKYGFGDYTIGYSVTSEHGCRKDTSVSTTFSVKPQMSFPALPGVCENLPSLSIAKAVVQNSVPGTGIYKGKGTDAAGNFNPAIAGPGTHEIKYVFTTTGGCIDSISSSIIVWAAPVGSFDITSNACLDKDITITDKSPASSPAISSWKWELGDNSSVTYSNGNPFTKRYAAASSYTVTLTVTDTRGCVGSVAQQSTVVHPLPVPAFTIPAAICLPGATLFTNQSSTPDNSSLQYKWNMGDGTALITSKDASHEYRSAGSYTINLEVTTAFGCTASKSGPASGFRNRPDAKFTVSPQAACQGSDHNFVDKSTTSNGSITGWKWDFGDGNTSTVRNPVKQYSAAATYTVKLVVTDAVGCTSAEYPLPVTAYVQPVIDAGEMLTVIKGNTVTFKATANQPGAMKFAWTPAAELTNANTLSPAYIATHDEVFTLTATSNVGNCTATDQLIVKVLKIIMPPTAFTPNGDGIHDKWEIEGLAEYQQCSVQVFNRYGQSVYSSAGYNKPWDGTMNSKLLPAGTYYYIITDKGSSWQRIAGAVTIIR